MSRLSLRDPRFWLLLVALLCFVAALVVPPARAVRNAVDVLAVVDITGSMNTRDYADGSTPQSRFEKVKAVLRQTLVDLPCQSRFGLAIFAERRIFLLFDPIEVCENFAPITGAITALNWREAWEGDSHIAGGLYRAIALASDLHTDLVFMTDGQEAPPLPWSGGPAFDGTPGAVKGLIVGVGGYALSPIPKYDDNGREIGFYGPDDVLQESRFGLPPPGAENRPGYNARNAPFGEIHVAGHEQLSSVKEPYLKSLADKTGLVYAHLVNEPDFLAAMNANTTQHPVDVVAERGSIAAALGLICLGLVYAGLPLLGFLRASHFLAKTVVVRQRLRLELGAGFGSRAAAPALQPQSIADKARTIGAVKDS
jgi:mxaL protein